MQAKDPLVNAANHLMDESEWASARELYRTAFLCALPEPIWIGNLRSAETQDRVHFWETLGARYPDSAEVWNTLILVLVEARRQNAVVRLCTQRLQEGDPPFDEVHTRQRTHWLRFKAALGVLDKQFRGPYTTVPEDFSQLWHAGVREEPLQDLMTLRDPAAIPMLEALAGETWLPASVKQLLDVKIHELRLLAALLSEYQQVRPSHDVPEATAD